MIEGISANWNHGSTLPDEMLAVILAAECPWLQVVTEVGFTLAALLVGCEEPELREGVAQVLADKLLEAARTGRIPGMTLQ